jgi:nucleolar protein 9
MLNKQFPQRFRRKIINHILGSVVTLAKDAAGSHIIDACWQATYDMRYYREKMAKEMADQADVVRVDFFGRQVWRNWNMDGFVGARFDWGRTEGEQQERQFAKRPEVKTKKPWQKEVEKRASGVGRGIVTKHSARVKSE